MRATLDEGTHLGGIAAMLRVADVCPQCGQNHPEPRFAARSRGFRDCPAVVMGSFPVLPSFDPEVEKLPAAPAPRQARDFERTAAAASKAPPMSISWGRRGDDARPLAIPWLPLPDLGEVL